MHSCDAVSECGNFMFYGVVWEEIDGCLCWWFFLNMSVLVLEGFRIRSGSKKFIFPWSSFVGLILCLRVFGSY